MGRSPREMDGTPGDGRAALWARMPELLEMSPAALAVLGDFVPFGVSQSTGRMAGGNSLDNTIRVANLVPTEWVLLDIRIHAIAAGFAHGLVHLWAEDGTLSGHRESVGEDPDVALIRPGRKRIRALTRSVRQAAIGGERSAREAELRRAGRDRACFPAHCR